MNEKQRKKILDSWQGKKNNAQGHFFEGFIKTACTIYKQKGIAYVEKMPEPFMVLEKRDRGIFKGRFIAHAQPDFMGTLRGGRSVCFEAKYTATDKLAQTVLTTEQWYSLERHWEAGAKAGACAGIGSVYAFIPWAVWRSMKDIYGRKYMTAEDMEPYRVKFNGACMFLDPLHPEEMEGADWYAARAAVEAVEVERLETALQTVLGVPLAARLVEIVKQQPKEKQAAFLETTLKAALGGADYSACKSIEDMADVYAKYFVETAANYALPVEGGEQR